MKRAGFTMIELIFVIVILGILAAVAIPKLAATRTDAGVSKVASNIATAVSDIGAYYTSKGTFTGANWSDMTNVRLDTTAAGGTASGAWATGTAVYLNDGTTAAKSCFSISATTDGNVSVTALAGGTDPVCVGAKAAALKNNVCAADGTAKVHAFGGVGVAY
ncbi:protein containing prepilin-type cleavage/methylation, N-terminal domain [Sulfurimonas gotlandica GD1]|uniref:Protein containing prepilin-type cleavage/methylation, N-terminal domain n=1 Tax=Sulfurimonas gotlandica (strain DSM 19862 / JCM 16533 / GD1) TaxID=929558 RepID=B6BM19_SULGG|nr:type II secretion system protein [Sulfurimonas gotlandica]EDZ61752.1 prepilin-type N-terminal cleavage/methylation domain protein [Sulfurimonas gotlandica GD1]EHP29406.1 protein containing prepilin-type cleavage/methylation, N-terminal domain [Sulfurimonas gotlandica GD1]